jgi:D-beta-D-heptose 7-phosphate kinase/D-beta-D-heptose 1-phosphate adenosyltransferase
MSELSELLRAEGKKLVFTNGCFDIIHSGHVTYLYEAASFGDILVVGLNSDDSVHRLKGSARPLNNQKDRAIVLSALEMVDYVCIFEEDTPLELIELVKPDILVKGGDYSRDTIVGADFVEKNGGEVRIVKLVEGKSTTNIIDKMKKV